MNLKSGNEKNLFQKRLKLSIRHCFFFLKYPILAKKTNCYE